MEIVARGSIRASAYLSNWNSVELVLEEQGKTLSLGELPMAYQKVESEKKAGILSGIGEYSSIIRKAIDPEVDIVKNSNAYMFNHRGRISFEKNRRPIGTCDVRADNFTITVHEFGISEDERGKGYGKEALQAIMEYGAAIGKVPIFEVCHLSQAFDFLVRQDFDVLEYPEDPDEYAYLVHPGHTALVKRSYSMGSCSGNKISAIEEFARRVRKATA